MEKYLSFWYTGDVQEIEENKEIIMLDLNLEELKALSKKDRMVAKYMEEIKRVNEDPDFYEFISAEEDNRKIENSIREEMIEKGLKEGLERGLKQGLEQGIEKGLEQGIEQGLEQGLEQGKKEANKQVVITMLKKKLDIPLISECTGLTIDMIKKIQESMND